MRPTSPDCTELSIPRRSFIKLTVGSIVLLPTVADALLLPHQAALAAESEQAANLVGSASIYVVRSNELGLVVRDISVPDDTKNLIAGADVKIVSHFNGETVTGQTDDAGAVHFDIAKLAEDAGKSETPARYEFNASIEISAPGYRKFCAKLLRIKGGSALGIPTQPRQTGVPYPKSASFDEWDVLYSTGDATEFVSCTGNDATHTIALDFEDCPAGEPIEVALFADGTQVAVADAQAASDGTASIAFSDTFLLPSSSAALPTGENHSYTVRYVAGDTLYEIPIKPTVVEAPPEAQDPQVKKDLELTPFNDTAMFLGISVPENWPLIGGNKIKLWQPNLWFNIAFDPFGFIRIRATTPEWGYVRKDGKPDPNAWKFHPRSSATDQYNQLKETIAQQTEDTLAALVAEEGFIKQIGFTSTLSFTAQLELMAAAVWEFGSAESRGRASVALRFGANYSLMETFWAGPFPLVVRFGIGLNGVAAGQVGFISPSVWSFSKYRWDWTSTGFDLQVCFSPTLSIGVGIGGVCSLSFKGLFAITYSLHDGPLPKGFEDKPMPRARLAGVVMITVEIELLFFTDSYKLYDHDWPDWYDSWDSDTLTKERSSASPLQGRNLAQMLDNARIITAESLAAVAEFSTAGVEGMNAKETQLTRYEVIENSKNGSKTIAQLYLSDDEALARSSTLTAQSEESDVAAESTNEATSSAAAVSAAASSTAASTATEGDTVSSAAAVSAAASNVAAVPAVTNSTSTDEAEEPSDAMVAQADDEVTYTLRASNDQITCWETTLPSAAPVGDHNYEVIPVGEAPGVLCLGKEVGVRPTTDMRIAENILSSSHLKLFTTGGKDYIVRIGAVMVAGKVRTRIIAEQIGTSNKRVIDFQTCSNRDECFDYDFDISTVNVNGVDTVNLVVISGTRDQNDSTLLSHAAGKTLFTFITSWDWNTTATFQGTTVDAVSVDAIGLDKAEFPFRNYSCPQIVQIVDGRSGWIEGQSVVTYLERAAISEEDLLGTDPDRTKVGVGLLFFNDRNHKPYISDMDIVRKAVTSINDPSITEITFHNRVSGWHLLMMKGSTRTYYVVVSTHTCATMLDDGTFLPRVLSATVMDVGELEGKLDRLIFASSGKYFLTCLDGKLKQVNLQITSSTPKLALSDIGTEDLNVCDFGVTTGDVLYWPASRENAGYTFEDEGAAKLRDGNDGALNLIMGARIRNGKLSRAFPLCEVDHPMHRIRSWGNTSSYMSFISSTTIDSAEGKGEQWYTAVPWVRCATLLDAAPNATLYAVGDHLSFYVTLRNDGNCYLSGVELTVAEVGGAAIGSMRLDFLESTIRESEWNPRGEDGELENVEDDWQLAPGTTSRYYAEYVTIPEAWEGEREVEIYVSAAYAGNAYGMGAQAEDESIDYIPDRRVPVKLAVDQQELTVDYAGEYGRADITVLEDSSGSGNNSEGGNQQRSATPRTGDPLSAAVLALGGAAGLAAYGVLRSSEERANED